MKCPHCGKEFNGGSVMGSVKSEKKRESAKRRGEIMRRAFELEGKLGETFKEAVDIKVKESLGVATTAYPDIGMPYKEYMANLPKDWRVSEKASGTRVVYDRHGICHRIFKAGRDY